MSVEYKDEAEELEAAKRIARIARFTGPLNGSQLAGLMFLLFKGGLYWADGSYAVEGKDHFDTYLKAADQGTKDLRDFLKYTRISLGTNDVQNRVAAIHKSIKDLMVAMDAVAPWTYCGELTPEMFVKVAQLDLQA